MLAKGTGLAAALGAVALLVPAGAAAQSAPFAPYDGSNPFNCELQDVGTGTDFPDPDADPFCVKFDKTSQSVLPDAGLVDFLAQEPFRVAAAAPKCFYYQRDEWTGALIQGEPPELWHWVGGYFFDKAKGIGGVSVREFRIAGQPASAASFVPPAYAPYFDEAGGGGVMVTQVTEADPACVALAEEGDVYANDPQYRDCVAPGGELEGRRVGRVRLGMAPKRVRSRLGKPRSRKSHIDRWCVIGGASLRVAYRKQGVALIRTSSRGHSENGVRPGDKRRRADRKLDLDPAFRIGNVEVAEAQRRAGRRLFAGIRGRRVRWLAMVDPSRLSHEAAIRRVLRRAR